MVQMLRSFFKKSYFSKSTLKAFFEPKVAPDTLQYLMQQDLQFVNQPVAADIGYLYLELRNSSRYLHHFHPKVLADVFGLFLESFGPVLQKNQAVIDYDAGPQIQAYWSSLISGSNIQEKSIQCALEINTTIGVFNALLQKKNYPPFQVSLGLDYAPGILGNIPNRPPLSIKAISEASEMAKKLQILNTELGTSVLVTAEVLANQKDRHQLARYMGTRRLRGNWQPTEIYEIMSETDMELYDRKTLIKHFETGFRAFEEGEYSFAIACLKKAIRVWPKDDPSVKLLARISQKVKEF